MRLNEPPQRAPFDLDRSAFAEWARGRARGRRDDDVARFVRLIAIDPTWPGGHDRDKVLEYMAGMQSGRMDLVVTAKQAWREFEDATIARKAAVERRKARRASKAARKRNRGAR